MEPSSPTELDPSLRTDLSSVIKDESYLEEIHWEKRDLLEETHRKDEEMESLQDRVTSLETSNRVALDHLESVPEKLSLLEDFKDFRDSHGSSERTDGRYFKYKGHSDSLQLCLDDAKYRIKRFKDDRILTEDSYAHRLDHSSSWQEHSNFLSSPRFSHLNSLTKRTVPPDSASIKEDATGLMMNRRNLQSKKEEYESKKSKM